MTILLRASGTSARSCISGAGSVLMIWWVRLGSESPKKQGTPVSIS